jgi:gliding motility-associated-like protein
MRSILLVTGLLLLVQTIGAQSIELYQQFNGRFDYTAIGNTMNLVENGPFSECTVLTSSSAQLRLNPEERIIAAYLYWAGSGEGDFEVELNNTPVVASRTFSDSLDSTRVFFAAFADVTELVLEQGNTSYVLSDLDITDVIENYCTTGTNFAGWALTVVYEDEDLPLNQLNIYDGLESVPSSLSITLNNLNVLDNENAKIGFIAWEGDASIAVEEQLSINNNILSNPPLNPEDNAFNGSNSFTGQSDLYNMDLDVYNIQNNIAIGDTSATIRLSSGQDFVMINTIITVLNSQLPDATMSLDEVELVCDDRNALVNFTAFNLNSTEVLPAGVPISFYYDETLIGQTVTTEAIPIGGTLSDAVRLLIPGDEGNIQLRAVIDDQGDGSGIITEINEDNNESEISFNLLLIPETIVLDELISCNEGFETARFNLFQGLPDDLLEFEEAIGFYETEEEAKGQSNPISLPEAYSNNSNPQFIFIRLERDPCYLLYELPLVVENCPPSIPEGFSPNGDGKNDFFNIRGLYDIFLEHQLYIYNRNGSLIFKGDNSKRWSGYINQGIGGQGNKVPVGNYYYVLDLFDPEYRPFVGWVYVNY